MPEWTSKKQVLTALEKARKHWAEIRKQGYDPGSPQYDRAKAECVKLDTILRHM